MKEKMDIEQKYGFISKEHAVFPPMVVMEITNVCNLKCIHCPYVLISKDKNYKPAHMSWEVFTKIVDEVSAYKGIIFRLLSDGEPMMHPRFLDMVSFAKLKGIEPLNFITNGMFLDAKTAVRILELGVDAVEVSLDARYKKTYEKIRRGGNYELVMSNTHRFIELRNEMNARTKIMVSIIDQPEAAAEIEEFISYWEHKADRIIKRVYTSIRGLVDSRKMKAGALKERWPCPQLWMRMFISLDGRVEFCVEDWHDKTVIGDVRQSTLKEIWHSPEYENLRMLHKQRKFSEIPYCRDCKDWKAREWGYDYFYALEQVLKKE